MASMLVQAIVAHNPIEALVMARSLARQGFDTTETQEAAIAALAPKPAHQEPRNDDAGQQPNAFDEG